MPFYIHAHDKIEGPWEAPELIAQSGIDEKTQVCTNENFSDWRELGEISELKLLLQMREANTQLREKKQVAEKQVRDLEDEYEDWARELHGKIADLNGRLEERLHKLDEAAQEISAKSRESELFKTRLRELKSQYLELKQYSEIQEKDFLGIRKLLKDKLDEREQELQKVRRTLDETTKKHAEREHALQEQERTCRKNDWEMRHMEEQWLEVHQQSKLLQEAKKRLEDDLRAAEADAVELRKTVLANEREVREAPARAMKAELEVHSLRETLESREADIEKFKAELAHNQELTHGLRLDHRLSLDKIAQLENELRKTEIQLRSAEQEIVRLNALSVEREHKAQELRAEIEERAAAMIEEKDMRIVELRKTADDRAAELLRAREEVAREQSEQKKLDVKWRAREEELREEIRQIEHHLFKYREDNEALERRSSETTRKLNKSQDAEAELRRQIERLKGILLRKTTRIEMLESYIKEPEERAAGEALHETAGASAAAGPGPRDQEGRGLQESKQAEKVQTHVLKNIEGRIQHIEGLNQLLRDNMHQMVSERHVEERRVDEADASLGRRFSRFLLWFLWCLLVCGVAWVLHDLIREERTAVVPLLEGVTVESPQRPVPPPVSQKAEAQPIIEQPAPIPAATKPEPAPPAVPVEAPEKPLQAAPIPAPLKKITVYNKVSIKEEDITEPEQAPINEKITAAPEKVEAKEEENDDSELPEEIFVQPEEADEETKPEAAEDIVEEMLPGVPARKTKPQDDGGAADNPDHMPGFSGSAQP
ncbi:MAG: hypothetical protein ABIJ96_05660 [Elusimicrobiota bacterium]